MRPLAVPGEVQLHEAAARLGAILRERGWRLATAESSTAGLIGHAITMIPGASDYYVGGVICYSNTAKEVELGVPGDLLARCGAVSDEVAAAMAEGARRRFGVDIAVAVTGIAGPEGATAEKPIGRHYVAVARGGHPPQVEQLDLRHDRDGNRAAAALSALEMAAREAASEA
jgi:nicotinamide-nucleotide amidase